MAETARERESDFLAKLGVDPARGLSSAEVAARRRKFGPNILAKEGQHHLWQRLVSPLLEPMALLLVGAGIVYFLLGDRRDAAIMFLALVPIVGVDYALEERAQRTLSRLKSLVAPRATVMREGRRLPVAVVDIVPGDIVLVQEGDILPADGILVEGADVRVDESSLTGEAGPVAKFPLQDRQGELFAGSTMVTGRGTMAVTATATQTEYGRIGALVAAARPRPTPTQRAIDEMVRKLGLIASAFLFAVVALEFARGAPWLSAVSAGVSLAIAILPEEFPVVFTLYLTFGAWRMARRNALIRRLAGVEALGSVSVICADKTGTLTEGRMSLTGLYASGSLYLSPPAKPSPALQALLEAAVLASEPNPYDPLEQSLLAFARRVGLDANDLYARWRLVAEYPFEAHLKYVTHIWRSPDRTLKLCSKGAIEGILRLAEMGDKERTKALEGHEQLARDGMRVLAVAEKQLARYSGDRSIEESGWHFVGLIGFTDPPRAGVPDAIAECQRAGIRVVMITGDHPLTAHNVAEAIGLTHRDHLIVTGDALERLDNAQVADILPSATIFARISPVQKHRLVRLFRESGAVVAMTGDGINDAPALREADVGVAMGRRGTAVAREAATMVILDDNFQTIVAAVREGRRIFDNLQHVFRYLIAFHIPIVFPAFLVPFLGAPLLLLPAHLVWMELILHPTASLVFEADAAAPGLMRRRPRPAKSPFLPRHLAARALAEGAAIAAGVLGIYFLTLGQGAAIAEARSIAVSFLVVCQTLLVLMVRSPERPFWHARSWSNKLLLPILAMGLASLALFLYVPALADVMAIRPLDAAHAGIALAVSLLCTIPIEMSKYFWR